MVNRATVTGSRREGLWDRLEGWRLEFKSFSADEGNWSGYEPIFFISTIS